jgi:small-conductance mechanosensitive channel
MKDEQAQAQQLKKDSEVRQELDKTGGTKPLKVPKAAGGQKFGLVLYVAAVLLLAGLYSIVRLGYFDFAADYVPLLQVPLLQRFAAGATAIALVFTVLKAVRVYLIQNIENLAARYNLTRVAKLLAGITIFFVSMSVLFANWYTAVVSFGLISLILGLALQTPITSFIGWIYILVKSPYRVGDRIKIGDAAGDVIGLTYLDTTLWEFGGELLTTANHPSGRLIRFPNSMVLNSVVHNYSWPLFPYVWNDIKFFIAYQSDLEFVARTMRDAASQEVGDAMMERVRVYRELLAETPVNELEVKEHPVVNFRVHDNTWIEAIVRYLVEPKRSGAVKSRLIKTMLKRLNEEPEKVLFPKADMR